jgi:NAD-dependent DNA ligase
MSLHSLETLRGICAGVLADGELNQDEAEFLLSYLSSAPTHITQKYPANILIKRLVTSLEDGHLDDDETGEILTILLDIINGVEAPEGEEPKPTVNLEWQFDECHINFEGHTFVVTGTFESASRGDIEAFIKNKGGLINKKSVTKNTNYVLVGSIVSKGWVAGNYGRKIEQALLYREQNLPLKIISEKHWISLNKK